MASNNQITVITFDEHTGNYYAGGESQFDKIIIIKKKLYFFGQLFKTLKWYVISEVLDYYFSICINKRYFSAQYNIQRDVVDPLSILN